MNLYAWAARWQIPLAAIQELQGQLGLNGTPGDTHGKSEAYAQSQVVLEAAQKGAWVMRNNVGALKDESGRVIRFGLANDSPALNKVIKSADLIGIRPVIITPQMIGLTFGQFISREVKAPGWRYTGDGREAAQLAWALRVCALGGDACFATGPGTL